MYFSFSALFILTYGSEDSPIKVLNEAFGFKIIHFDFVELICSEFIKYSNASSNSVTPRKLLSLVSLPVSVYLPANGIKYFGSNKLT